MAPQLHLLLPLLHHSSLFLLAQSRSVGVDLHAAGSSLLFRLAVTATELEVLRVELVDADAVAPPLLGRPEALGAALQPALEARPLGAGDGEERVVVLGDVQGEQVGGGGRGAARLADVPESSRRLVKTAKLLGHIFARISVVIFVYLCAEL